jgi:thymidylate synthase (FAD)
MITIVEPHFYWPETTLKMVPIVLEHIERCGRVCYKSEDRITDGSAERFVKMLCDSTHESVLEHISLTAIIICSRACSHQLVRHRIAAYSQESMRYVNYGKKDSLQVICPPSIGLSPGDYDSLFIEDRVNNETRWLSLISEAYREYRYELANGIKPEDARYVLPHAAKTEVATTFNIRQWRHVFKERAINKHAQWEIRGIFSNILQDLKNKIPVIFDDLGD